MERRLIIDRDVLKSKMVLKRISTRDICDYLNISDVSFYNKLNGKREFTETEISTLIALFGGSIFFTKHCYENGSKRKEAV